MSSSFVLPPELIKLTAINSISQAEESCFAFADSSPLVLSTLTNHLVFGPPSTSPSPSPIPNPPLSSSSSSSLPNPDLLSSTITKIFASTPSLHPFPNFTFSPSPAPYICDSNLIIFLSGSGETTSNNKFAVLGKHMGLPQTAVLSLIGPDVLPLDLGYAWYQDISYETGDILPWSSSVKRKSLNDAITAIVDLIEALNIELKTNPYLKIENVFLYGFSSGGIVAMEAALAIARNAKYRLGGVISICAGLAPASVQAKSDDPFSLLAANMITPAFVILGGKDKVYDAKIAKSSAGRFHLDSKRDVMVVPGKGHAMVETAAEAKAVFTFLAPLLMSRMPAMERMAGSVVH